MSARILYTSEDGQSQICLLAEGKTVWLSQLEIAKLSLTTDNNFLFISSTSLKREN